MGTSASTYQKAPSPRGTLPFQADTDQDEKLPDGMFLYQGIYKGQSIILPESFFQELITECIQTDIDKEVAKRLVDKYKKILIANLEKKPQLKVVTS
jgi:hypothetical protein